MSGGTPHVELTRQEREEVATYYGEFFRSGGKCAQPSPFQLDALNDELLRDTIIFWQIAGDPETWNPDLAQRCRSHDLSTFFGPSPAPEDALAALTALVGAIGEPELEKVDTTVVLTLMHAMWLILGGDFWSLAAELEKVVYVYAGYGSVTDVENEDDLPHIQALTGVAFAAGELLFRERNGVDRDTLLRITSEELLGLPEDHPNTVYAREAGAKTRRVGKARAALRQAFALTEEDNDDPAA